MRYFPYSFRAPTLSIVVSIVLGVIRKKEVKRKIAILISSHLHENSSSASAIFFFWASISGCYRGQSRANDDLKYPEYEHEWKNGRKTFSCSFFFCFLHASAAAAGVMYYQKSSWRWRRTELYFFFVSDKRENWWDFLAGVFLSYHFFLLYFFYSGFFYPFPIRKSLFLSAFPSVSLQSHNFTHQNNSHILVNGTRCHQSDSVRDFSQGLQDFDANPPLFSERREDIQSRTHTKNYLTKTRRELSRLETRKSHGKLRESCSGAARESESRQENLSKRKFSPIFSRTRFPRWGEVSKTVRGVGEAWASEGKIELCNVSVECCMWAENIGKLSRSTDSRIIVLKVQKTAYNQHNKHFASSPPMEFIKHLN